MKDISSLSLDLKRFSDELFDNLVIAQSNMADKVVDTLKTNINKDTGTLAESIYRSDTSVDNGVIKTFVGSDLVVGSGRYNLGYLLEHGTNPHIIEPKDKSVLRFMIGDKEIFAKMVFHSGMVAYNNYFNALNDNKSYYRREIRKAIKNSRL